MEALFVFFLIIVYIAYSIFIGVKFDEIASEKGYSNYFWWVFLLGVVGMIMVAALPDRNNRPYTGITSSLSDESKGYSLSKLASESKKSTTSIHGNSWRCQHCGTSNSLASATCKDCGEYR